jgi:hypothetical protein
VTSAESEGEIDLASASHACLSGKVGPRYRNAYSTPPLS